MGRKAGITLNDVADAATSIADRHGLEAATLTAVAAHLGIKTPSLYNHVSGLAGLKRLLAMHGAQLLLDEFKDAAGDKQGAEALRAVANADRVFAARHPGLFQSFLPAPRPGEDDELYDAMAQPVYMVAGQGEAIHLIRAMWALLHGFLDLEAKGGFGMPVDIDASFDASIDLMIAGIETVAARANGRAAT